MIKHKRGHAINGECCQECGAPFREQERIIEIWSTTFGKLTGKKHWDSRTCEKLLNSRKEQVLQ